MRFVIRPHLSVPGHLDNTYGKTLEQRTMKASSITWEFGYGTGALTIARSPQARFTRSYDTAGRLIVQRAAVGPSTVTTSAVFHSQLSYDSRDRISGVTYSASTGGYADTYTYDPAGRLKTWGRTGAGATSATYTWDAACNLTSKVQGGATTTFVSDADDRLETATTGSNVTTYTHDLFGRRTSAASPSGTTTYGWNPLGQLTSVATAQSTAVYSYGATGMREKTVVTQGGTTKVTESVWDGMRLAAERDSDGTLWRYSCAPDGTPLALTRGYGDTAVTYSYHTDAQGSVTALTNAAGTVVASYRYDAFGAVTATGGTDAGLAARNPLRYRGYYLDVATGLYYLPARYYDPATARFLSRDPAPPSAGDPLSLNAYAYCTGDPVNSWGPTGAVTDVEWGAWNHYYTSTGGNRPAAEAANTQTHAGANARRARARGNDAAAASASARAAAAEEAYALLMAQAAMEAARAKQAGAAAADAAWDTRLSWQRTHPTEDGVGVALTMAGATCDLLALATAETVAGPAIFLQAGYFFDGLNIAWNAYGWIRGTATAMDVAVAVAGAIPGASGVTAGVMATGITLMSLEGMGAGASPIYRQ